MENNIKYCLTTPIVVQFGPTHYTRTADNWVLGFKVCPTCAAVENPELHNHVHIFWNVVVETDQIKSTRHTRLPNWIRCRDLHPTNYSKTSSGANPTQLKPIQESGVNDLQETVTWPINNPPTKRKRKAFHHHIDFYIKVLGFRTNHAFFPSSFTIINHVWKISISWISTAHGAPNTEQPSLIWQYFFTAQINLGGDMMVLENPIASAKSIFLGTFCVYSACFQKVPCYINNCPININGTLLVG